MEDWLNDMTVDGFLYNLREPEKFIKMDSKWNASMMSDSSKPPSEEEGGTMVEDPIGLLNMYEYNMSENSNGYLNNGLSWLTITPITVNSVWYVLYNGIANNINCVLQYGIRPSINLRSEIKVVEGDGSEDNPYRLEGDNDTSLNGIDLNTRYSGEYITFGTGENNLYRIVSHETKGLTKVTSAELLKENGKFKASAFGDIKNYSNINTIGSFLNEEYLNNGNYLTGEQVNMIEDSTIWYLGIVENSKSYKLAKYIDTNMSSLTSSTTIAKVGLSRLGELMSGQFDRIENNTIYWTLTPYQSATGVFRIATAGFAGPYSSNTVFSIKPSFNLKSNTIITSGDGTKENPFVLELAS